MKEYTLSPLVPPNIDADLIGKVYVFCRELTIIDNMIELPRCLKQPDQMTEALTPQAVRVPKADLLEATLEALHEAAGHTSLELINPTLESDDFMLPKVLAIPDQLLPLLIDEPAPHIALDRVNKVANLFTDDDVRKELFNDILASFRAACVKRGGRGSTSHLSRMITFCEPPTAESVTFKQWKNRTIHLIYQEAFPGTPAAPTNVNPFSNIG